MDRPDDLLGAHIETLYLLDGAGDLVATNEPYPPARRPAPAFHLGWTEGEYRCAFRGDVPSAARHRVLELLASRWPFGGAETPPGIDRLAAMLAGCAEGWCGAGPAFVVPDGPLPAGQATAITAADAEVLRAGFADSIEEVGHTQPTFAVVVDGRPVSLCQTVRRSRRGIEAGVDTLEGHRRRGHGRRAVAAWCAAARQEGLIGFYSTSWSNTASRALARSLGLTPFAAELSLR